MKILHLDSALFPDRESLDAALATLDPQTHSLHHLAIPSMDDDAGWDRVVDAILDTDSVIT